MLVSMRVHDEWLLLPQRLAVHEPTGTAVVADLHLGYCEARRQGGDAVPLVELGKILKPLERGLKASGAKRLVIAGDLFEKAFVPDLWQRLLDWLKERNVHLLGVVPGNHDRRWLDAWPLFPDGFRLEDWLIVHGHVPVEARRVVLGHWHPAVHFRGKLAPCFLAGADQLVLPAFSPDATGVDVRGLSAWHGHRCLATVASSVIEVDIRPRARAASRPRNKTSRPWSGRLRPG